MAKRGRPCRTYTTEEMKLAASLAGYGLTNVQIANYFAVSIRSFERAMNKQKELYDALLSGRSKAIGQVTQTLYKMATSGKCPSATIFYLKCRAQFKEPKVIEHYSGDSKDGNGMPGLIIDMSGKNIPNKQDETDANS